MAPTRGAARHHAVRRAASPSAFSQPPWLVHARARAPAGCGGWTGDLVRVPGTDWLMMQAGSQPAAAPPSLNCVSLVSCLLFGRRAALLLTATLRCARPGPRTQAVPRPRKGPVVNSDAAPSHPIVVPSLVLVQARDEAQHGDHSRRRRQRAHHVRPPRPANPGSPKASQRTCSQTRCCLLLTPVPSLVLVQARDEALHGNHSRRRPRAHHVRPLAPPFATVRHG